jgi:hypothetical protein
MQPRLKPGFYVRALIRRAEVAGAAGYVLHKGSEEAGAVIIKLSPLDGTTTILVQARAGAEGGLVWMRPLGGACDEKTAAAFVEKQRRFDPDLWVVEIEDRQGRNFVDEAIV